ncbi:MAG TPA: GTP-binding protein [Nevskiaceae bacterium]|nr:GTP-binding protein [Nevskiaceae bacterium]
MSPAAESKLLFAGPMGAGKTTAVATISDRPPVSSEADNLDRGQCDKASTTVGLDYGETRLDDGHRLRLYGLPGQERFAFLWRVAADGALGVILLADHRRPEGADQLTPYLEALDGFARRGAMVVGVSHADRGGLATGHYSSALLARGLRLPVFTVDVRQRGDVLLLLETLLLQLEAVELLS